VDTAQIQILHTVAGTVAAQVAAKLIYMVGQEPVIPITEHMHKTVLVAEVTLVAPVDKIEQQPQLTLVRLLALVLQAADVMMAVAELPVLTV
jgi:hypothetical protein